MPLERFKNMGEASRALWLPVGSPLLPREWEALYQLSLLAPVAPPQRGVRKFRDIDEANRDTETWVAERVRAGKLRVRSKE